MDRSCELAVCNGVTQVTSFLQLLLLDLQDNIADYHVDEFMEVTPVDVPHARELTFPPAVFS